ncbi:MAG TPA: hypothetical protein VGB08_05100 [Allosphingosinicella sp.]|jgi:hypothetical protein
MTIARESAAISAAVGEGNAPGLDGIGAEDGGLSLTTAELMALGGDARITLDEQSGLNSYGCAPKPMPAIAYASSTASTVSAGAFAQARAYHFQLQQAAAAKSVAEVYADGMQEARRRLCHLYGLTDGVDIAFGPSGTDLEYLVVATAMRGGRRVRNIVVEVDEVGSGCLNAQKARYFAPRTALGRDVEIGAPVPGFPEGAVTVETIGVRNEDGSLRRSAERRQALEACIAAAIDAGQRPLLHVVHRSKTGLIAPRPETLAELARRFGEKLDIVVDACQGRISPEMIRDYLALGAVVFVTGSKFLGGPPFSAFALVPEGISSRMRGGEPAPEGLGGFFARGEMPASWTATDGALPEVANFGLLLRLECGLFELSRLLAFPDSAVDKTITAFGEAVRALPGGAPLRLLDGGGEAGDDEGLHPLDRTMLHTFELTSPHPWRGGPLSMDDARAVYLMLFSDMSDRFRDPRERMIAAETVHVGQPVRCARRNDGSWRATLRLSLSAPQIGEVAGLDEEALLRRFRTDLDWICAKIELLLPLLPKQEAA